MSASTQDRSADPTKGRQKIVLIASLTSSLTNFRLELIKELIKAGHEVVAMAPDHDPPVERDLRTLGVRFIRIPMSRAGVNPIKDVATLAALVWHFLRERPSAILPYTMKPIIYGGIAARLSGISGRYFLVTGLGHMFAVDEGETAFRRTLRAMCVGLYRLALKGAHCVFVYNEADFNDIEARRLTDNISVVSMVPGSGVDLQHYGASEPPLSPPVFLLVARLLHDKGIAEFVEAARVVRARQPGTQFQLIGHFDPNPTAISSAQVSQWVAEGAVQYLGTTRDIRLYLKNCSVFVLPSYYREGIPRSILEAMATGRAIITTDLPGCRDTVEPGINGVLVRPRDSADLAGAIESFLTAPDTITAMGNASRRIAEKRFDVRLVNRLLLSRMNLDNCAASASVHQHQPAGGAAPQATK
ncbi:glycosyltransferase family 4 protein [Sinorhizobium sp. NFACC03]|uniref:glycosyltransferase family 4 protein n=1 Tax=Sinorhizobium sp. NFACC03 TaxID=1566295 RepID=UPI00087E5649|nr:glycosyltransferase family 4 protein [Sinorhizobium sp. NFACC03]SDA92751.1 Glycosyltransferase involved in cell wall bisynthesis [Sinorhizobium sp. NFACC03]